MKMHRILGLEPGGGPAVLVVAWDDELVTRVDLAGVIARVAAFAPLGNPELFHQASIIDNGLAIAWPGGLDYAAASLRDIAEEQRPMSGAEFAAGLKRLGLSIHEAADFFDVTPSTIKNYRKSETVPRPVRVMCRHAEAQPAVFRAHYFPRKAGRPRKAERGSLFSLAGSAAAGDAKNDNASSKGRGKAAG